jgi:phospholipid/cholesterol/gamma-HCH transport system substrate-binding protein
VTRQERTLLRRAAAVAILAIALATVVVLALRGTGAYTIHAQFLDAGQIVAGDEVQLGGDPVGSVDSLKITPNGLADLKLKITDPRLQPLHVGTTASIGSPGLSGVANRYVRLQPGPGDAPKIPDGGVLGPNQTHGIVDLDELIDGLDAPTRKRFQLILRQSARVFAAPADRQSNAAIAALNPALSQLNGLGHELVNDQGALDALIRSTADVSTTLARRRSDLGGSISSTAGVLEDVAGQRRALQDTLQRAPAVLKQAGGVLARTRTTLTSVDPAVRHLRPVAPIAARLLRQVVPVARNAEPAITAIRRLLPQAHSTLVAMPELARTTVPALHSGTAAFKGLQPIVTGLRGYSPDLIGGFFEGFAGNQSGYYDANGHFARIQLALGSGSEPSGPGGLPGYRTGLDARCPGAASEPVPDGSAPYVPADSPNLCDPGQTPKP